jgi:hypothetical protein
MTKIFYNKSDNNPIVVDDDANISDWPDYTETVPAPSSSTFTEKSAREIRNNLLSETDFYGLSDGTMSSEMTTYRQALRDLPDQAGFPNTITWPTKPT